MIIQNNIAAANSYHNLNINRGALNKNTQKLSSGYRINRAGDDAAGLVISEKMRTLIRGLSMAKNNCNDAISLVQTADGALQEVHNMLHRMNELAVQALNGTYDETDRNALQQEFQQLQDEIDHIGKSSEFNGMKLFDATEDIKIEPNPDIPSPDPDAPAPAPDIPSPDPDTPSPKPDDAPKINISVGDIFGRELQLDVSASNTIGEIKEMIASSKKISADRLSLAFNGTTLNNDKTLEDYSIQNDSKLRLSISAKYLSYPDDRYWADDVKILDNSMSNQDLTNWESGFYVVESDLTINGRVNVNGKNVNLILADGANLIVNGGIDVEAGKYFKIFSQSRGDTQGRLESNGYPCMSGIGGAGDVGIFGGVIVATAKNSNGEPAGIGNDIYSSALGNVNIFGGNVTAVGCGKGIGNKAGDTSGKIRIMGGIVTANGIGSGNYSERVDFTMINGNAVVFSTGPINSSLKAQWEGVIFEPGKNGKIYGNNKIIIKESFAIPDGQTLEIEAGKTLEIARGVTLTNLGNIINNGTIINYGTIVGKDKITGTGKLSEPFAVKSRSAQDLSLMNRAAFKSSASDSAALNRSNSEGKNIWVIQLGSASENKMEIDTGLMNTSILKIEKSEVNINTENAANNALKAIKNAVTSISLQRSRLGAYQNRLQHAMNNLIVAHENAQSSESQIRDSDMAEEMLSYTKNNILIQSSQAMLTQANIVPEMALRLLG